MSSGPRGPLEELSREELIDRVEKQEQQLSALQSQVASLRQMVEGTARAQAEHEREQAETAQLELRGDDPEEPDAERVGNLYFGEYPIGNRIRNGPSDSDYERHDEEIETLFERVSAIEIGEIDPGEVMAHTQSADVDLLSIHQLYNTAKASRPGESGLTPNKETAALLFPHFGEYGMSDGHGKVKLNSVKVREIIDRKIKTPERAKVADVENPNSNTIKRVMENFAAFDDIFEVGMERGVRTIVCDRDEWLEYVEELRDADQAGAFDGPGGEE